MHSRNKYLFGQTPGFYDTRLIYKDNIVKTKPQIIMLFLLQQKATRGD